MKNYLLIMLTAIVATACTVKPTKLQGIAMAKRGFLLTVKNYLKEFKRTFYYKEAIQAIFGINEPISAEYNKNGHYFSTKEEFFTAYISPDNKSILNYNKKTK